MASKRSGRRAAADDSKEASGLRHLSMEIVEESIPDPDIEAMPREDRERLVQIAQRLMDDPAGQVAALEELRERYEHIPTIWNYLAAALRGVDAARADQLTRETAERFPDYLFGVCAAEQLLLQEGDIEAAGALLERGPHGPRLTLPDMCPGRTRFHISEAIALGATVGAYYCAIDRIDDAKTQLEILQQIAPEAPQTEALEEQILFSAMFRRLGSRIGRKRSSR